MSRRTRRELLRHIGSATALSLVKADLGTCAPDRQLSWCEVDSATKLLYVAKTFYDEVNVLNVQGDRLQSIVEPDIKLPAPPERLALDSQRQRLYVAIPTADKLLVADTRTREIIAVRPITAATAVAVDPNDGTAYVANPKDGVVSVLSGDTVAIVDEVQLQRPSLRALAVDPISGTVYASHEASPGWISVLTRKGGAYTSQQVSTQPMPSGVVVGQNGKLYVTHYTDPGSVSIYKTADLSVIKTLGVGALPISVAVDPFRPEVYVANHGSGTLSVINGGNLNRVEQTITISWQGLTGKKPIGLAVDAAAKRLYVVCRETRNVFKLDTNTYSFVNRAGW